MGGETNLALLLKNIQPVLHEGDYVFCITGELNELNAGEILFYFREKESTTIIVRKEYADEAELPYEYISSWITLNVHSSLEAVGLTAAFSQALASEKISCNVVAAYYHDHIFVARADALKAMEILQKLSG